MTTQNKSDDRAVLWFFMSRSSEPVLDIERDAGVNMAYTDPGSDAYVSVGQRPRRRRPREEEGSCGTPMPGLVPGRRDDPDLALVAVTIKHAEYWDVDTNKMVKLFKIGKAAMTGVPPKMGKHRASAVA